MNMKNSMELRKQHQKKKNHDCSIKKKKNRLKEQLSIKGKTTISDFFVSVFFFVRLDEWLNAAHTKKEHKSIVYVHCIRNEWGGAHSYPNNRNVALKNAHNWHVQAFLWRRCFVSLIPFFDTCCNTFISFKRNDA